MFSNSQAVVWRIGVTLDSYLFLACWMYDIFNAFFFFSFLYHGLNKLMFHHLEPFFIFLIFQVDYSVMRRNLLDYFYRSIVRTLASFAFTWPELSLFSHLWARLAPNYHSSSPIINKLSLVGFDSGPISRTRGYLILHGLNWIHFVAKLVENELYKSELTATFWLAQLDL
jgi:hypothetical protein